MARVNAYLRAGNDAGREVSVGGRSASDSVWASLNTDNSQQSDCALHVRASVVGANLRAADRRRNGDDRRTIFSLDLPVGEGWEMYIHGSGDDQLGKVRMVSNGGRDDYRGHAPNAREVNALVEAADYALAILEGECLDEAFEDTVNQLRDALEEVRGTRVTQ